MAVSKYHDELVKRGYERFGSAPRDSAMGQSGETIKPVFAWGEGEGYSVAFDETGAMWMAQGEIDLTDLDFEKNEKRLNEVCDELGYQFG